MPKSTVSRKKLFRDYSKLQKKYINKNFLKNISLVYRDMRQNHDLTKTDLDLLFFVYDLEFFTIEYVAKELKRSSVQMRKADKGVYYLAKRGYIYKHFDKLTPSQTMEDHLFRDETKYNYRVRYALSQKGRLLVQQIYRKLEGTDPINVY
jgi:3-oxoacyl-[acyl-carrier-protein] synthase III